MQTTELMDICNEAIKYVRRKLSLGAANQLRLPHNLKLARASLYIGLRPYQGIRLKDGPINEAWIRAIAIGAETAEAGNCGEQAAVAYLYLLNRGVSDLDYMQRTNGDHAFVLVGRSKPSDSTKPETWGANSIVCDPWYGVVFPGSPYEINKRRWQVASFYPGD